MSEKNSKKSKKNLIIGIFILIISAVAIYAYFRYDEMFPSTDDAYIGASLVNVAPKLNGYLKDIAVTNNQIVHQGDLLFSIDSSDYNDSYQGADQNYLSQVAQAKAAKEQVLIQQNQIVKDKSTYDFAKAQYNRYKTLFEANTIAKQAYQNVVTNYQNAKTQLDMDNQRYRQMKNVADLTDAKANQAKANLNYAKSNLNATKYFSPVDGYITNLSSMSHGEFVSAGQNLFGIVDTKSWWVDANFKETQLARIKPGQKVKVILDMYDGHIFDGVVQSISYASGNTFSLLPAQNATGNWVKVTQRFTVRIKIENDLNFPLRVGASAKATVNTFDK